MCIYMYIYIYIHIHIRCAAYCSAPTTPRRPASSPGCRILTRGAIHIYIYIYIHIYIYVHIYIYIYIYIYPRNSYINVYTCIYRYSQSASQDCGPAGPSPWKSWRRRGQANHSAHFEVPLKPAPGEIVCSGIL